MGNIKQGILGGFSGKVGTVVGSNWKGISYMRAIAPSIRDARTAKQLAQREKFKLVLGFLRSVQSYVRVGFRLLMENCRWLFDCRQLFLEQFINIMLKKSI